MDSVTGRVEKLGDHFCHQIVKELSFLSAILYVMEKGEC